MKTFPRLILLMAAIGLFGILISNAHAKQIAIPSLTQDPAELLVGLGAEGGQEFLYLYGVARRAAATVDDAAMPHVWWFNCDSYSTQLQVYSPFKDQVQEGASCETFHLIGNEKTEDLCRFRCRIPAPQVVEGPASQRPVPAMRPEMPAATNPRRDAARPAQGYNPPTEPYDANTLVIRSFYPMPEEVDRVSVGFHLEDLAQKLAPDRDHDGVPDGVDNCFAVANFDQSPPDEDKDGKPDVCIKLIHLPLQPNFGKIIGDSGAEQPGDATEGEASERNAEISGAGTAGGDEQTLLKKDEPLTSGAAAGAEGAAAGCSLIAGPRP